MAGPPCLANPTRSGLDRFLAGHPAFDGTARHKFGDFLFGPAPRSRHRVSRRLDRLGRRRAGGRYEDCSASIATLEGGRRHRISAILKGHFKLSPSRTADLSSGDSSRDGMPKDIRGTAILLMELAKIA